MESINADYGDVKPTSGWSPIPKDKYLAVCTAAEGKKSQNTGNLYVQTHWKVVGGRFDGKDVKYHNIALLPRTHDYAGLTLHALKALRQPHEGKFQITPSDWVGRHCWISVAIKEDNKGVDRNVITKLDSPSVAELRDLGEEVPAWLVEEEKLLAQAAGKQVESPKMGGKSGDPATAGKEARKPAPAAAESEEEVPF